MHFLFAYIKKKVVSLQYETKGIHKYSTNGNSLHFDYYADIQILSAILNHNAEFYILQISRKNTLANRVQR